MVLLAEAFEPPRPGARIGALIPDTTAVQIGVATAAMLTVGLFIAILTTPDPLWWQLHFSQLGTFAVFSGYVFNATIVFTGAGVVVFALRLRTEMLRHADNHTLANRRAATVVPILVVLIGVHVSFVGLVPVNTNEFLHDRASTGAVFSFIASPGSSRWLLREMHRDVARATRAVSIGLVATIASYVAGFINLAAFELVVFSLVFFWLLFFARNVGRPARRHRPSARPLLRTASLSHAVVVVPLAHVTQVHPPVRGTVVRGPRRPALTRPRQGARSRRRVSRPRSSCQPDPEHHRGRVSAAPPDR